MGKITKFIIYNAIVYFIYMGVDTVFTFLHFYSSDKLGKNLTTMPTQTDTIFIFINIMISTISGYILMKKIDEYMNGE